MMALYLVVLLAVIVLALGLLALVALVAAANQAGDTTRLTGWLRTLLAHLNGEAAPPAAIGAIFAPLTRIAAARAARRQATGVPEPAVTATVKLRRPTAAPDTPTESVQLAAARVEPVAVDLPAEQEPGSADAA